jgi:hypothetical protein
MKLRIGPQVRKYSVKRIWPINPSDNVGMNHPVPNATVGSFSITMTKIDHTSGEKQFLPVGWNPYAHGSRA